MSPATYHKIGAFYGGLIYETVRQIIAGRMLRIWQEAPPDIQKVFPWDQLPLGKPESLESRVENSLSRGGASVKVAIALLGIGDEHDQLSDFTNRELRDAREVIKGWGINIIPTYQTVHGEAKRDRTNQILAAETPDDLRESLTHVTMRYFLAETRGKTPILTKLGDLLARAGKQKSGGKHSHRFIEAIEELGFVVGKIEKPALRKGPRTGSIERCYFLRSKDITPELVKALQSLPLS